MSGRAQYSEPAGLGGSVRPLITGTVVGVIVCIAALLLLSAVLSTRTMPQALIDPMAIFSISVGAFASGISCSRMVRSRGLLHGALCGAAFTVIVLLASLSVSGNTFGVLAIFKIVFMMLSAMLGGVLGVNVRAKKRRK